MRPLLLWLLPLCLSLSCRPGDPGERPAAGNTGPAAPRPLAILQTGEDPLWFELGAGGPRLINSPGEAELSPFSPWPLTRHIRAMLPLGEDLVMAVNRDGFLWTRRQEGEAADPAREGIALYRTEDPLWREYSAASLFRFGDRAAVLLYRDDFFADSAAPLPDPRIRVLDREEGRSLGAELPALAGLDAASGWDVEALRPGRDGRWYYRAVNKGSGAAPVIRYYASESLDLPGEAVETGRFRDSALPEIPGVEPLRSLLKALSGPSGGSAALVSPAFAASRRFLLGRDWSGGAPEAAGEDLQGYYREEGNGHFRAVLILPGGRGFAGAGLSSGAGTDWRLRDLSLPPLPENFVYTGAGLSGDTLFASWEEQEDYNIGAAGFMAIRLRLEP